MVLRRRGMYGRMEGVRLKREMDVSLKVDSMARRRKGRVINEIGEWDLDTIESKSTGGAE
jgi:hypothetical protein